MAKPDRVTHVVTIGDKKYDLVTSNEYDGIKDVVGIAPKKDTDKTDYEDLDLHNALKSKKLVKITVAGTADGLKVTPTNKRKSTYIYCVADKALGAYGKLIGKAMPSFKIRTAYTPRRRYLS